MNKWLFWKKDEAVISCLLEENKMTECRVDHAGDSLIGQIYVAQVAEVAKNLRGAFLKIGSWKCYLPFDEKTKPFYCKQARDGKITAGDELLVQIEKDAIKTKEPTASHKIELSGRYCVVSGDQKIAFSKKITSVSYKEEMKAAIEEVLDTIQCQAGILIRTNAEAAPKEVVLREVTTLCKKLEEILQTRYYRTAGSCLWEGEKAFLQTLRDLNACRVEEIVTNDKTVFEAIKAYQASYQDLQDVTIRFYQDESYPMEACYRLEVLLDRALEKQVWLSSGAYLVIEPTEALTAIDVNSGKANAKKKETEEFLFEINKEAACEVMRQLRLRNLSGMILVDFINMKEKKNKEALLTMLRELARKDPVRTTVVDLTPLGLVEMTRKKERDTLAAQCARYLSSKNGHKKS